MIPRRILLVAIVILAMLVLTETQSGQTAGVFRANKQHEIILDSPAIVGDTLLPAGTYTVRSHGSGATQQVLFMREVTLRTVFPETSSVNVFDEVGRVSCVAKSRAKAAELTELHFVEEDGTVRIVSADIKGEAYSCIF